LDESKGIAHPQLAFGTENPTSVAQWAKMLFRRPTRQQTEESKSISSFTGKCVFENVE
jgi:hypothetical protein